MRPDDRQNYRSFLPRLGSSARQLIGNPLVLRENGWFSKQVTRKLASRIAFWGPPVTRQCGVQKRRN